MLFNGVIPLCIAAEYVNTNIIMIYLTHYFISYLTVCFTTFTTLQLFFLQRWKGVSNNLSCFPINLQEHNHQQYICKNVHNVVLQIEGMWNLFLLILCWSSYWSNIFHIEVNYISHEFLPKWDNEENFVLSFTLKWMVRVLLSMQHLNFTFSSSFGIRTELKIP